MYDDKFLDIRTSQPFIVLSTEKFFQHRIDNLGMSHFFMFTPVSDDFSSANIVADACSNIIFVYKDSGMEAFAIGPTIQISDFKFEKGVTYFGARFNPGENPCFKKGTTKSSIGKIIDITHLSEFSELVESMKSAKSFEERIQTFWSNYQNLYCKEVSSQKKLYRQFIRLIVGKKGILKIKDLIVLTGYSARYINQIFEETSGMGAKQFCNLVRLHFALCDMNYTEIKSLAKFSTQYSYYDAAHFSHEFKKLVGKTPGEYLSLVHNYKDRVVEV